MENKNTGILRICIILLIWALSVLHTYAQYDVVIVGGTPGGIMSAISSAREGKSVLLLERTSHLGGLPANGLGATDIATRGATTGLFIEFVNRIKQYYIKTYGETSQQVIDCSDGYHFEPSVAEHIFEMMLHEQCNKITILKERQFDSDPTNIEKKGNTILSIRIKNRKNKSIEKYEGKIFIDATYEGDLGAAAGVPFRVGRESRNEFEEIGAGKVYRYWEAEKGQKQNICGYEGYESEGTTFIGDNAVQAYNFRLCLTKDKKNMRPIEKPENYNRNDYISLIEDVWTGRNTSIKMASVTPQMIENNKKNIAAGNKTQLPGDRWGIAKITNMVVLPNEKTDANNQHLSFLSTDLPEENWPWPTASWEWRDKYAQRLRDYTLGLLWFVQNDKELPPHFRQECKEWGLSSTEYSDNKNFPRQVYVREGRRFEGKYFFTTHDALPVATGQRPPLHTSSITASHYALDSHAVFKREKNRVHLDGFISYPTEVYTVPYGVIVPKNINNLLLPVPVSGSHIGFSTLRMEPCWMALGQAAGIAASIAIDENKTVQNIAIQTLQQYLIKERATLIYFEDIKLGSPDFEMVQYMGIRGYLPEWEARLSDTADEDCLKQWREMSGIDIPSDLHLRGEILHYIYQKISVY